MKLTEKILAILLLTSIILKYNFITGGTLLFIFIGMCISMIYFIFGFALFNGIQFRKIFTKESYTTITGLQIIAGILAGLSCSQITIGILFKLQYWPGADPLLFAGLFFAVASCILSFISPKNNFNKRVLSRMIPFTLTGILLILISSDNLLNFQYRNHPKYIKATNQYKSNPNNMDYFNRLMIEQERIHLSKEEFEKYFGEKDRTTPR